MICHRCGCPSHDSTTHCPFCGAAAYIPQIQPPKITKKGKRLPVIILAVLFIVGTLLYFLIPMGAASSAPLQESSGQSELNPLFQKDCFLLRDGVLYFDDSQYADYPILIVPAAIDGQSVTTIGEGCFQGISGITTIILPSSITAIGDRAFAGCSDLRGLCIGEAVTSIGTEAFTGCINLEAVYIPMSVSSIGEDAFLNCPAMRYLFYSGFYTELYDMYPQVISPFTWAICLDGDYRYGGI